MTHFRALLAVLAFALLAAQAAPVFADIPGPHPRPRPPLPLPPQPIPPPDFGDDSIPTANDEKAPQPPSPPPIRNTGDSGTPFATTTTLPTPSPKKPEPPKRTGPFRSCGSGMGLGLAGIGAAWAVLWLGNRFSGRVARK